MVIGIAFGGLLLFWSVATSFIRVRQSRKQKKILVFLWAISMAILAFCANPPYEWDLYRHFIWMDQIRASKMSLFQFLFNNPMGVGSYPTLICYNLLRYIICYFTTNNHWLPCICAFIDYIILGYIMMDWYDTNNFREKITPITILLSYALFSLPGVFSGIRTSLAFAIMGLGVYIFLYKKGNILLFVVLTFVAATIHEVALMAVPFVLLARVKLGKKGLIGVAVIAFSMNMIAGWLYQSKLPFFLRIAQKFYYYTLEYQDQDSAIYLGNILFVIAFLALYFIFGDLFKEKLWDREQERLYMFLIYLMCFQVCNIGNTNLFGRPCVLLGIFAPALASFVESKRVWASMRGGREIQFIGKFLCGVLCCLSVYAQLRIVKKAF